MKFVDYAKIYVKAGDGGRGCVSFRREKYVPKGGPNGGDGGRGGNVIIRATGELHTLLDFRYKRQYKAQRGAHGMGSNKQGKEGEDLLIPVPLGTIIRDAETGEILADLDSDGAEYVPVQGGRGGQGNAHFATPTRQTPRFAQPGEPGQDKTLILELKLIADVGLAGLPNAGKSTLISKLSSARPKIADYPFTTLIPNLGVVRVQDYKSFVMADIPGIIEGAHRGAGLGLQFLRHIERAKIILHLVDISEICQSDPVDDLLKIRSEIALYSPRLAEKPFVVAGSKEDIQGDGSRLNRLEAYCLQEGIDFFVISSATGKGLKELVAHLATKVCK